MGARSTRGIPSTGSFTQVSLSGTERTADPRWYSRWRECKLRNRPLQRFGPGLLTYTYLPTDHSVHILFTLAPSEIAL